jgi:glycerophosphoryl diester phosphodiesterase
MEIMRIKRFGFLCVLGAVVFLMTVSAAFTATECVWIGGATGNLKEKTNWPNGTRPSGNADAHVAVFTNSTEISMGSGCCSQDRSAKFVMRPICKQGYTEDDAPGIPGNSLEAFKLAWKKGAKLIETDCWMTKDGRIILVHDSKVLNRQSGEKQPPINELTQADIARIDIGKRQKSKVPIRIPYLEDVLATMPKDAIAQCEVQGWRNKGFFDAFEKIRINAGLSETNFVISSGSNEALRMFRRRNPKYRTLWLCTKFLNSPNLDAAIDKIIKDAKRFDISIVCPRAFTAKKVGFTLEQADRFRAAGIEFRIWGVNTAELFAYAKYLKVPVFTCAEWKASFEWAKNHPDVEILP